MDGVSGPSAGLEEDVLVGVGTCGPVARLQPPLIMAELTTCEHSYMKIFCLSQHMEVLLADRGYSPNSIE